MSDKPPQYLSFLLRMWQVKSQDEWIWRASLECPETGEIKGFPDLESLFTFLESTTQSEIPQEEKNFGSAS